MATEEMSYDVIETRGDVELRQYAPAIVAETKVSGPFEWVGNVAFGRLAGYIFGRNRGQRQMAMTAPVHPEHRPREDRHDRTRAAGTQARPIVGGELRDARRVHDGDTSRTGRPEASGSPSARVS